MGKKIQQVELAKILDEGLKGESGIVYRIESELNVDRYRKMQQLIVELEYGLNMESIYNKLIGITNTFNKKGIFDGIAEIVKLNESFHTVLTRGEAAMKVAALFLNSEHEDRTDASDELIEKKIADWGQYEYIGFFQLCTATIKDFKESLRMSVQNGSITLTVEGKESKKK